MSYRYYYISLAEHFLYLTPVPPQLEIERVWWLLEYCYCILNKIFNNYVLNLVNFSKFEGIPSWIWLLFFGAGFQLFGVNKILNRNEFGEGNDTNQGRHVFLFY
jgi:hypothetical protein